jgi:hypothetical protein
MKQPKVFGHAKEPAYKENWTKEYRAKIEAMAKAEWIEMCKHYDRLRKFK